MQARMDTSENETVRYAISTDETMQYFNGSVNGNSLHYNFLHLIVNSDV